MRDACEPDLVLSWTENAYVRHIFRGTPILYAEMGPIPRIGFVHTVHLDPVGHQTNSVFERLKPLEWVPDAHSSLVDAWHRHVAERVAIRLRTSGMEDWITTLPKGRKRILVALQPNDWLTYEGIGPSLDPTSFLRLVASSASEDDVIIPQWHPGQTVPSDAMLAFLVREYPNLAIPPPAWRQNQSELLLPYIDAVTTISSNVALAGAIRGLDINVYGRCKFSALATPKGANGVARPDLIPFLVKKLCRPLSTWQTVPGGFVDHIKAAIEMREEVSYPDSSQASDLDPLISHELPLGEAS